jgi:hypothetical protein
MASEAASGQEGPENAVAAVASGATCSNATLDGRYLFAYDGEQIQGNNQGPFATAGFQVHDGINHVHGRYSANFNGTTFNNEPFSGTYTVHANCTGTATFTDGTHYDLFIAPDGTMFTFVQTNHRYVTSGTAQRVGP